MGFSPDSWKYTNISMDPVKDQVRVSPEGHKAKRAPIGVPILGHGPGRGTSAQQDRKLLFLTEL